jgi:ATPase subunit of ABC transporter with duplicated ATPase domains
MQLLSEQTGMSEQEARNALGGFGIAGTLATSPCGVLSGGQKSRVVFTLLSHKAPSLLILDEPTNFLDMATIDSLIEALDAFGGASLVVSHDLYFLRKVRGWVGWWGNGFRA